MFYQQWILALSCCFFYLDFFSRQLKYKQTNQKRWSDIMCHDIYSDVLFSLSHLFCSNTALRWHLATTIGKNLRPSISVSSVTERGSVVVNICE